MPSYDYKCQNCNKEFTITKSMTDASVPDCPECKSSSVNKIWGGIQFKGCGSANSSGGKSCGACSGGSCLTCK